MVKVTLKWNKSTYENVEVNPSEGVASFKAVVSGLTAVPPNRQKLMAKGCWPGTLKDDADLSSCPISDGAVVMLMGTADTVAVPVQATTFVEDMTVDQIAQKGASLPAGLQNLGNTCYLNSTLQCLRDIGELRPLLVGSGSSLPSMLAGVLQELDRSGSSVVPYAFLSALRSQFPQFAEMQHGRFSQQDAEELLNAVLASMHDLDLRSVLSVEVEETITCNETNAEPVLSHNEVVSKLVCNIQGGGGSSVQVDHLMAGLKLGMETTIEKHSSVLGRNASWTKTQRIASLPKYICIQFMRFFWKATPESRDHTGVKCKIMRAVKFSESLDLFEFCTPSLQEQLQKNRQQASKARDAGLQSSAGDAAMDTEDADLQAAIQLSLDSGIGEGIYELSSLVTHKGRSADSGHYKAYVRESAGSNVWRCFDDDKVSEVSTEDVLRLYGNGDSDMAYLCFYRRKEFRRA